MNNAGIAFIAFSPREKVPDRGDEGHTAEHAGVGFL